MKSCHFALVIGVAVALPLGAQAQPSSAKPMSFPVVQGKTYKFEKIADGVYYATGGLGSNNVVIVNDQDVLIVDTGTTPATARAFVADIKMLTDKPVRYVVNTHWHYDHTDGNSIFGPEVQIIATDFLRTAMTTFDVLNREPWKTSTAQYAPAQLDALKKQIADEKDAGHKAELTKQLADMTKIAADLKEVKPTPPNITYSTKMVLHRGAREIDFLFARYQSLRGDSVACFDLALHHSATKTKNAQHEQKA